MKKFALIGMAVAVLMMMAGPASANPESKSYGTPALGQGDLLSTCLTPANPGPAAGLNSCVTFAVPDGAVRAEVTITDQSGQTTYGTVGQDYNDDGLTDSSLNFCGATGSPGFGVKDQSQIPVGVAEIIVFPHALPGLGNDAFLGNPQPCGGVGTAGTVTVTWFFS